ncbi:class II ribonucleotide reductase [Roseobacter phage RD-1410Ws-07]|uniref:Vitamin B12-dependent ribonucleotide reductase n=2 Tax=Sanyabayvirus DS1410Ws06 TaxID=2844087 RepID=A0A191VYR9_9CAUD|nr:ribonucleotide reductase [Dinoroseobacter phage DS-1410Ws-06]ANJ20702.1 class II ribonucleotide reductase [Dinoroseobacter phage DS-1410Ws-06]ANJ20853.1 class II ribonucleotide reductase [Roseobacter phage RD-1410Ws-07]
MGEAHFDQPISEQIWNQKYRFQTDREGFESDKDVVDTWGRIAGATANVPRLHNQPDVIAEMEQQFFNALYGFKFLPAGRINSGAGTERNVTLFNCYVMGTIPDSLAGIFDHLKEAALTMQQGGGIGYDFSTLRPMGAPVRGVESFSSGPISFMDVWNWMCKTIESAGNRRGAMMATMHCEHPDIKNFITAKQDPTRLRHFNVSVLVTDAFMEAVKNDDDWTLHFKGEVYEIVKARELWDMILQSTYDYAEPGVIFIDRINKQNNLWFLEEIRATNPCGEQPLPPYGACLLGSINLPRFVFSPFTQQAQTDWQEMEKTVRTAVRMLDCVIDTSNFPLEEQRKEAFYKRRQGLGVTGVADMLFMLGMKYGSGEAVAFMDRLMKNIAIWAYEESIEMAKEWGPAPFAEDHENRAKLLQSHMFQILPEHIGEAMMKYGIRNSHLLSIAPTGTISMYGGNVSSGIEPIFFPEYSRNITNADGTKRTEKVMTYCVHKFHEHFDNKEPFNGDAKDWWWSQYMVTAQDLDPAHHIHMQGAAQKWIDSSISKTVNIPVDYSFDDFKAVYELAYDKGCKGCTTYRPNDVTGSILFIEEEETKEDPEVLVDEEYDGDMRVMARPAVMDGSTYKIRWGSDSYYVTFNNTIDPEHDWFMPFEIFINSKTVEHHQWTAALTRMISAVFQRGGDVRFVAEELKQIHDPKGGQWQEGRYWPSLVALIGQKLSEHLDVIGYQSTPEESDDEFDPNAMDVRIYHGEPTEQSPGQSVPDQCPSCKGFNMVTVSGCPTCQDCGYSKCG